jgi:cation diffusion facilitator CzcD-associated flavoprotein CzcO
MSDVDVAVVGRGPYGLAVGARLARSGVAYRALGRPMASWIEQMPAGMYLKSEGFASNIWDADGECTLAAFCSSSGLAYGDYAVPVSLDTFVAYGLWLSERDGSRTDSYARRISAQGRGFAVELEDGERFTARRVVVAVGTSHFAYVPDELEGLPHDLCSHTCEHRDLQGFAGRRVAVVGGGQSALETAALLREAGAVPTVVVRKPALAWNEMPGDFERPWWKRAREPIAGLGGGWKAWAYSNLPSAFAALPAKQRREHVRRAFGPAGAWWLRGRIDGLVDVRLGHSIESAEAGGSGVRLALLTKGGGRSVVEADHVIAATGYRVSLDRLGFLDGLRHEIRTEYGSPVLSRRFESSVAGLYFTGLAAAQTFGPPMRFVYGTRFAADRIGTELAGRRARRRRQPELLAPTDGAVPS